MLTDFCVFNKQLNHFTTFLLLLILILRYICIIFHLINHDERNVLQHNQFIQDATTNLKENTKKKNDLLKLLIITMIKVMFKFKH